MFVSANDWMPLCLFPTIITFIDTVSVFGVFNRAEELLRGSSVVGKRQDSYCVV